MQVFFTWILKFVTLLISATFTTCVIINLVMYFGSRNHDITIKKDMAIVLGASVHGSTLSEALRARMETAVGLYQKGLVQHILLSGDGTDGFYSETMAMKKFALKKGIPEISILTDEKGYSTYTSILRVKNVFRAQSIYIVSQDFHLTRAVWIARAIDLDADGISAGSMKRRWYYEVREFLARVKDFFQVEIY
jgi:vancomycin permeability regulator SanA